MFIIRFLLVSVLLFLSLALLAPVLLFGAALRPLSAAKGYRRFWSDWIETIYLIWIDGNRWIFQSILPTVWSIEGQGDLSLSTSYVMLCNHLAWIDVPILHSVFERKIPHQKYFMKESLRWMPFAGQVCWALDYIFIKRVTLSQLRRNPGLRQEEIASLQAACRKLSKQPVTIVNFVEGGRNLPAVHQAKRSPYQHLLQPEGAGVAVVLDTLGKEIHHIVDVTLHYDADEISLWAFLCGRIRQINVRYKVIAVTEDMRGDYFSDRQFRRHFQAKLCQIWQEKDQLISEVRASSHTMPSRHSDSE